MGIFATLCRFFARAPRALLLGATLLALAAACESDAAPTGEGADVAAGDAAGDAAGADLAEPRDLTNPADLRAGPPTACAGRGGTCVPGAPSTDPPGFTVTCPAGAALDDGRTTATDGGVQLIQSPLALGCSQNPDGTTTPALCCLPMEE
jgi:hypothetical protein